MRSAINFGLLLACTGFSRALATADKLPVCGLDMGAPGPGMLEAVKRNE